MTAQQARIRVLRKTDPCVDEADARYEAAVTSLLNARSPRALRTSLAEAVLSANLALIENARRMGVRA